jgi:hypothetical protein
MTSKLVHALSLKRGTAKIRATDGRKVICAVVPQTNIALRDI